MPYNSSIKHLRPDRKKPKQSDIGEGPTKVCILGIISKESPGGCTISGLMNILGLYLRSQAQDRVGSFLHDLEYRELINKIDMPHISKNTKGYVITDTGKKRLEQCLSIILRHHVI